MSSIQLRLKDVAEIIMGQSPASENCNREGLGLPLLNGPTEFGSSHPLPTQFTTDPKKQALPGDLLFCVRGSTTGRMNWADQEYAIGRGIAGIRHKLNPKLQPLIRAAIEQYLPALLQAATGSTFPNVSGPQLADIPFPNFASSEAVAISKILSSLDDKIELNRRMNETLEAMARAIFKDWFVDFGPTRAMMEARAPYLAPGIWSLFPDRLDDDGKPEGWVCYSLGSIASQHTVSVTPSITPNEIFEHFSLPAHDAGKSPVLDLGETIKSNKMAIPERAILLSKLNPEIERVWIPEPAKNNRQICSTEFLVFTPNLNCNRPLLFGLFTEQSFRELLQSMVTGTSKSHQRVSPSALLGREVLIGSQLLFVEYATIVEPLLARTLANLSESRSLAATRDLLLPKLMLGEVRVKDTEKLVGEVV
jgi:type I restriction enzyme S subunit